MLARGPDEVSSFGDGLPYTTTSELAFVFQPPQARQKLLHHHPRLTGAARRADGVWTCKEEEGQPPKAASLYNLASSRANASHSSLASSATSFSTRSNTSSSVLSSITHAIPRFLSRPDEAQSRRLARRFFSKTELIEQAPELPWKQELVTSFLDHPSLSDSGDVEALADGGTYECDEQHLDRDKHRQNSSASTAPHPCPNPDIFYSTAMTTTSTTKLKLSGREHRKSPSLDELNCTSRHLRSSLSLSSFSSQRVELSRSSCTIKRDTDKEGQVPSTLLTDHTQSKPAHLNDLQVGCTMADEAAKSSIIPPYSTRNKSVLKRATDRARSLVHHRAAFRAFSPLLPEEPERKREMAAQSKSLLPRFERHNDGCTAGLDTDPSSARRRRSLTTTAALLAGSSKHVHLETHSNNATVSLPDHLPTATAKISSKKRREQPCEHHHTTSDKTHLSQSRQTSIAPADAFEVPVLSPSRSSSLNRHHVIIGTRPEGRFSPAPLCGIDSGRSTSRHSQRHAKTPREAERACRMNGWDEELPAPSDHPRMAPHVAMIGSRTRLASAPAKHKPRTELPWSVEPRHSDDALHFWHLSSGTASLIPCSVATGHLEAFAV